MKQFRQIGFFEILNLEVPKMQEESPCERSYMGLRRYFVSSMKLDSVGKEIKTIRKEIEDFIGRSLNKQVMYQSVSEAITNIYQHAYNNAPQALSKKWWLSVSYDVKNSELGIIVFDHGLGIPRTMEDSSKFRKYRDLLFRMKTKWSESKRLELAFERSRNRDGKLRPKYEWRGNGCGDIVELVSNRGSSREGSTLFVVSSKAQYRYVDLDVGRRGIASANDISLQGTLIEWTIKL
jgi:anti-sigma regulatory factor (Ser/Thr protein kinase)